MSLDHGTELLDSTQVRTMVSGILDVEPASLRVERLAGGVSAVVFRVESSSDAVVVKQTRSVLDVPWYWSADPGRSTYEALALESYGRLTPGLVPRVMESDRDLHIIVMEAAPVTWLNYKSLLMTGDAPAEVSAAVGRTLGEWHSRTMNDTAMAERFDRRQDLEDLRIHPYFEASAEAAPAVAGLMLQASEFLRRPGRCLVHGDATPKNVLTAPDGDQVWLLDPEVAHFGQPEFDVSLWASHLMLKMHRRSDARRTAGRALVAFVGGYRHTGPLDDMDEGAIGLLVQAVVEARRYGLSRVDYLEEIDTGALDRSLRRIAQDPHDCLDIMIDLGIGAA